MTLDINRLHDVIEGRLHGRRIGQTTALAHTVIVNCCFGRQTIEIAVLKRSHINDVAGIFLQAALDQGIFARRVKFDMMHILDCTVLFNTPGDLQGWRGCPVFIDDSTGNGNERSQ